MYRMKIVVCLKYWIERTLVFKIEKQNKTRRDKNIFPLLIKTASLDILQPKICNPDGQPFKGQRGKN